MPESEESKLHEVALAFTRTYNQTFDGNRGNLELLYGDHSVLTFESETIQGRAAIAAKLTSLPFHNVAHEIITLNAQLTMLNAQPTNNDFGILVVVTGLLKFDEEKREMNYTQVFLLLPNGGGGYYVSNDVFKLVFPPER